MFGVGAGAVALVLMGLYFNPWLLVGIAISGGVLYAGVRALQQAQTGALYEEAEDDRLPEHD